MIYFLYESYTPNTAPTNRALAYLRSLENMQIRAKVVFFLPDSKRSKIDGVFQYLDIQYCWDHYYIDNKVLKYVSYLYYVKRLLHQLCKGDKVYLYGLNDIKGRFIGRNGIEVFYEQTECPEVSLTGSWLKHITQEEHIEQCKKLAGLIVISQSLKEYFIEKGVNAQRIHVVNMTVDSIRFDGLKKDSSAGKYVAYCGTASNNKDGVDKLIRAFALFVKNYPDVKLYIIGKTPSKNDQSGNLELIKSLGLEGKVVLTGVIKADEVPQLLKNATILALARPDNMQAKYGFPTKLGEYLLTGNPVVVTSVGDIPRFLKDGESALIARADDENNFAEKMEWAMEHTQEAAAIGKSGKAVALQYFNAMEETKKLMDIIEQK